MAQAKSPRNGSKKTVKSVSSIGTAKPNGSGVDVESQIRVRAYELYVERGFTEGHEQEDWLVAEQEVKAKGAASGA